MGQQHIPSQVPQRPEALACGDPSSTRDSLIRRPTVTHQAACSLLIALKMAVNIINGELKSVNNRVHRNWWLLEFS